MKGKKNKKAHFDSLTKQVLSPFLKTYFTEESQGSHEMA